MKSYDETIASVIAKGDSIIEHRRLRAARIRRTTAAVSGLCAAAVIGLGIHNLKDVDPSPKPFEMSSHDIEISETVSTEPATDAADIVSPTRAPEGVSRESSHNTRTVPGPPAARENSTAAVKQNDHSNTVKPYVPQQESADDNIADTHSPVNGVNAPTPVNTMPAETQVQVTVTTADQNAVIDTERRIYMKKFTSMLTALSLSALSMPFTSTAAELILPPEIDPNNTFGYTNHAVYLFEDEIIDYTKFQNGELETDVNGDGKFDLLDCYEVFTIQDEEVHLNPDVNLSITEDDLKDYENLLNYYLITHDITADIVTPEYYNDPYFTDNVYVDAKHSIWHQYYKEDEQFIKAMNEMFAYRICGSLTLLPNGYTIFEDMMDKGILDLDFDSDGTLTPADMNIFVTYMKDREENVDRYSIPTYLNTFQSYHESYRVFTKYLRDKINESTDMVHVFGDYTWAEQDVLPEDQFNKCTDALNALAEYDFFTDYRYYYNNEPLLIQAVLLKSLVDTNNVFFSDYHGYHFNGNEDFDSCCEFFFPDLIFKNMEMLPEYSEASYYDTILPGGESEVTANVMDRYSKKIGFKELIPDNELGSHTLAQRAYDQFVEDVANGLRKAPDLNNDGVMNSLDLLWTGEMYSSYDYQEYPGSDKTKFTPEQWENIKTNCDFNNNGISGDHDDYYIADIYIINEFLIKNPDDISTQTLVSIFESMDEEANQQNLAIMESADIDRSGDANCDEETGLADALLILQNNANSEKYPLSVTGNFNADIYMTGDGITPLDALQIQKIDANVPIE